MGSQQQEFAKLTKRIYDRQRGRWPALAVNRALVAWPAFVRELDLQRAIACLTPGRQHAVVAAVGSRR